MKDSSIKLSQCMIVKNEEENIKRALSWGKDIVWEQIVVDTGSSDRTAEVAKEMGAKVFHFSWIDDFSAAKNYAIEQATGNWIAFLDADEYFLEKDSKALMRLLEQLHGNERNGVIRTKMVNVDKNGDVSTVHIHDRVFRNIPELRYHNRIHEVLRNTSDKDIRWCDAQDELLIIHTGYGQGELSVEKARRNEALLKKDLADDPENLMTYMYLGDCYSTLRDKQQAKECYRTVVEKFMPERDHPLLICEAGAQLMKWLILDLPEADEKEFMKVADAVRRNGSVRYPDVDYFMARWYLELDKIEEAAICFENALEKLAHYREMSTIQILSDLELVNRIIALAAYRKNDFQKALKFSIAALRIDKFSDEAVKMLLSIFSLDWHQTKDIKPYWHILCELYDRESLKDMLFVYKFTVPIGFHALMEQIMECLPSEIRERLV